MTDTLAQAHTQAVLDLLTAVSNLTVYDGKPPSDATYPHVVPYLDLGTRSRDRLGGHSGSLDMVVQITYAGASPWEAQWAGDRARDALIDVRPAVPGRACDPMRQILARLLARDDDDPNRPVYFGIDQYRLRSIPA